jgi:Ca2+/Na+ antiporter
VSLQQTDIDLSFGTIFGLALLAITIIPALCVLFSPGRMLHLEMLPLLRDAGFFRIAFVALIIFTLYGEMFSLECLALIGIYALYIVCMFVLTRIFYRKHAVDIETGGSIVQPTLTVNTL